MRLSRSEGPRRRWGWIRWVWHPRAYVVIVSAGVALGVLATAMGIVRWSSPVAEMERGVEAFSLPDVKSERTVAVDDRVCFVTCRDFEVHRLIALDDRGSDSDLCALLGNAVADWASGHPGRDVHAEIDQAATPCSFSIEDFDRDGWCAGAGVVPSDQAATRGVDVQVGIREC